MPAVNSVFSFFVILTLLSFFARTHPAPIFNSKKRSFITDWSFWKSADGRVYAVHTKSRLSQLFVQISYGGQFFWLKRHRFSPPSLAFKPSGICREKLFYYSGVTAEDFHLASLFSCGMNRRHRTTFNCRFIIKNPYPAVNLISKYY